MRSFIVVILAFWSGSLLAQQDLLTLQQAIDIALKNNAGLRAATFEVEAQKQLRKTGFDLPKTDVVLLYGQYNSFRNDNNFTISQSIPSSVFGGQRALNRSLVVSSEIKKAVSENELVYQVKTFHNQLRYAYSRKKLLEKLDSIYEGFFRSASVRYKAGEANLLEQTTAEMQRNDARIKLSQNEADISILRSQLQAILNTDFPPDIESHELMELKAVQSMDTTLLLNNPSLAYSRQQIAVTENERKLQSAKLAPDVLIGYFNQTLAGTLNPETGMLATSSDRFSGFQVGLSLPLWFVAPQGRAKAASSMQSAAISNHENNKQNVQAQLHGAVQQFDKNRNSLQYYQTSALPNAELILRQSQAAFRAGEIGYAEYLMGLRNAATIREEYLQMLSEYNQNIIFLEFLSGNK